MTDGWNNPTTRGMMRGTGSCPWSGGNSCSSCGGDTARGVLPADDSGEIRLDHRRPPSTRHGNNAPPARRPRLRVFRHRVSLLPRVRPSARQRSQPASRPGHHPPATPSTAPPSREPLNELKPPAAFRIAARRTQLRRGTPRPGPVGDLDPDSTVPGNDRDRDRLPGSTRAAMPDTIT